MGIDILEVSSTNSTGFTTSSNYSRNYMHAESGFGGSLELTHPCAAPNL